MGFPDSKTAAAWVKQACGEVATSYSEKSIKKSSMVASVLITGN